MKSPLLTTVYILSGGTGGNGFFERLKKISSKASSQARSVSPGTDSPHSSHSHKRVTATGNGTDAFKATEEALTSESNEGEGTATTLFRGAGTSELDEERSGLGGDSPARVLTSSSPLRSEEHDEDVDEKGLQPNENEDADDEVEDEDDDDDEDQEDDEDYRKGILSIGCLGLYSQVL